MRFVVDPKAFREAVAAASLPVRRGYIPILECLRVEARDNTVIVTGTDMDSEVQAKCEAGVSEAGVACVNAADLKAVVARMRSQITVSGDLTLESGPAKLTLPTLTEDFPRMKKPEGEAEIEGGVQAYLDCVPFACTEEVKFHIGGVCFDGDMAVATDGPSFMATPCVGGNRQVVPRQAESIIRKIGGRLFLSEGRWRVEAEGRAAMGKLVDGVFPDWRRISFDRKPFASADADALREAVEAVTVGRAAWVVLTAADDGYSISGDRYTGSHIDGAYSVSVEGRAQSFVGVTKQLLKILAAFEGKVIDLSTDGDVIRMSSGDTYSLLMSMRDARSGLEAA